MLIRTLCVCRYIEVGTLERTVNAFYSCRMYMRDVWCVITIRTYLYSSMEHIFKTDKKFVFFLLPEDYV